MRRWRWWAGCLALWASVASAAERLPVERVAPGVFVIPAPLADASTANRGRVANTGFIIGTKGVIVIDSGANHAHGRAILAAVRRQTKQPVRLAINTHPHPQNVLGNSAFAARKIPILASAPTRAAMDERCPRCLQTLTENVGAAAMHGTRIHLPDRVAAHDETLAVAGRRLRLLHFGHGHTEGDLLVLDETSGTLFAGDLVYRQQIPHLAEADTRGWLAALEQLETLPVRRLVPGRGAPGEAADTLPLRRYLQGLRDKVQAAYVAGLSADEALTRAELPEFARWQGYAARHGGNVQHVYFEIEREDLAGAQR